MMSTVTLMVTAILYKLAPILVRLALVLTGKMGARTHPTRIYFSALTIFLTNCTSNGWAGTAI